MPNVWWEKPAGSSKALQHKQMREFKLDTIFQYAPKYKCFSRTFNALCFSAVHSRTVGTGKSIIKLATSSGIKVTENSMLFKQMKTKDTLRRYNQIRKASIKYKQSRYFHRKRRVNKTLLQHSVYSSDNVDSCSATDHSYGLLVWMMGLKFWDRTIK